MTIVVPKDYHLKSALKNRRIECIDQERALREDIRALRIGILNIMPEAQRYEYHLLVPLGRSVIQIEPVWLRLKSHQYHSTSREHLDSVYVTFDQAIAGRDLDGLIVTGAPVEEIPFEEVYYWQEIRDIMSYARAHFISTLGICWGGLALAKFLGIEKVTYPKKLFGVFDTKNIDRTHHITGEMDDMFWCPQSRHSGIPDEVLEQKQREGKVNLLAYSVEAGYVIFESSDKRFLMHLGHLEYDEKRLVEEYKRDLKKGRTDVDPPKNIDPDNPINRWRAHSLEFFSQWIKYLHDQTAF
jgi:homoserine O-succinyltransferase